MAVRKRQKNVGDESGFLLNLEDARPDILGQVFEFRCWIAADRRRGHANESNSREQIDPGLSRRVAAPATV
jgi:hypothetical protein